MTQKANRAFTPFRNARGRLCSLVVAKRYLVFIGRENMQKASPSYGILPINEITEETVR